MAKRKRGCGVKAIEKIHKYSSRAQPDTHLYLPAIDTGSLRLPFSSRLFYLCSVELICFINSFFFFFSRLFKLFYSILEVKSITSFSILILFTSQRTELAEDTSISECKRKTERGILEVNCKKTDRAKVK